MRYASFINTASYMPSLDMKVYQKQTEIILSLAEKGPCVIVGRCADYILRDKYDCINVFICAEKADRIKRIAERYDLTEIHRARVGKRLFPPGAAERKSSWDRQDRRSS